MIEAADFVEAARELGLAWYGGVPCSFLTPFINHVINTSESRYLSAANEGDAVALLAGTALAGQPGVVMMQNSGLGNAVSPLTSLTWSFRIPQLLIVTWRGEPGITDEPQHQLMGRITPELFQTMEIPWEVFPADAEAMRAALNRAADHLRRERRPYALLMKKDTVAPVPLNGAGVPAPGLPCAVRSFASNGEAPTRSQALTRIIELTPTSSTVVLATTGYTGRELFALNDRSNQLYMVGSMGCVAALGLGLSLARPDLRVVAVDGDGAGLMRMGSFATIGAYGRSNLVHVLLDNGAHESTGGQSTVSPGISFAGVAAVCGYGWAGEARSVGGLDEVFAANGDGPRFLHVRIRRGVPEKLPRPSMTPVQVAERLMRHIGAQAS